MYNFRYDVKEKYDDIDVILRFLQQLYVTYFNKNGLSTVASCKKQILDFVNSRSERRLYFICCDIQDAFGSIIQRIIYYLSLFINKYIICYILFIICLFYFREII